MRDFKGKRVLVMGLGTLGGGVGTVKFFARQGASVLLTDLRKKGELDKSLKKLRHLKIVYILGKHRKKDFLGADLILRNPAVPLDSPYLQIARENRIPIEMAESLFMKLSPSKDIVGVTGTRGKSTTSTLIYKIFKKAGFETFLGGNVKDKNTLLLLDKVTLESKVVLELSSWQLQGLGWSKLSPHIAVVTNIYQDHLNRYKTMEDYINDKKIIFAHQRKNDYLVLNVNDKTCQSFAREAKSHIVWFNSRNLPKSLKLKIIGEHNKENAAAAYTVAKIYKIKDGVIEKTIASFTGLDHRLKRVRIVNRVKFINDSTSTTPIAGVKALRSFPGKRIILIAGGNSKNIPLTSFIKEIKRRVKVFILLSGTAAAEFKKAGNYVGPLGFADFKKAVRLAYKAAEKGDVVLFSPGVTHLPDFNEFVRGEKFKYEVKTLLKESKKT